MSFFVLLRLKKIFTEIMINLGDEFHLSLLNIRSKHILYNIFWP